MSENKSKKIPQINGGDTLAELLSLSRDERAARLGDLIRTALAQTLKIDPAGHIEDWDLLTDKVLKATYKLPESGKELRVHRMACDSGGEAGVTANAYDWWRSLKKAGLHTSDP